MAMSDIELERVKFKEISFALGLGMDNESLDAVLKKIKVLRNQDVPIGFIQIAESLGLGPEAFVSDILVKIRELKFKADLPDVKGRTTVFEKTIQDLSTALGLPPNSTIPDILKTIGDMRAAKIADCRERDRLEWSGFRDISQALGLLTGNVGGAVGIGDILARIDSLKTLKSRDDAQVEFSIRQFVQITESLGLGPDASFSDTMAKIGNLKVDAMSNNARDGRGEFREVAKALSLPDRVGLDVVRAKIEELLSERNKADWKGFNEIRESLGLEHPASLSDILTKMDELKLAISRKGDELMEEADRIISIKGRDYTKGSSDRLANFRTAASDAGITPLQAWLVFYNKHHAAICSYIRSGSQNESEPIFGRFVDALNYLRLGWLLVKDAQLAAEHEASK